MKILISKNRFMDYWCRLNGKLSGTVFYYYLYPSYWHYLFHFVKKHNSENYFSAVPNRGAGIGHQMSNWNSGLWFSKQFDLHYAHTTFAQDVWENFLGFGENVPHVKFLQQNGYKKVRLPLFDERKPQEVELTRRIIDSYGKKKVVFVAEQDQRYNDQYGIADDIRRFFYMAKARENDVDIYDHNNYNIAIHARRGDIVIGQTNNDPNLTMRWSSNSYFVNVLKKALDGIVKTDKPIHIYLFSQGKESDFPEFAQFENVHYCLDMNPQQTFLGFINADLLITSKSSFSYKPALISDNLKICPANFWHSYPEDSSWILADDDGNIIRGIKD